MEQSFFKKADDILAMTFFYVMIFATTLWKIPTPEQAFYSLEKFGLFYQISLTGIVGIVCILSIAGIYGFLIPTSWCEITFAKKHQSNGVWLIPHIRIPLLILLIAMSCFAVYQSSFRLPLHSAPKTSTFFIS